MIKPTIDLTGRIAIYARVSTEEQATKDEGSLDNQIHRCRNYLTGLGHDTTVIDSIRVYREEGFSGKDTNRPEFQRLMRDIRGNKIGMLVFTELSRVSRSVSDFLVFSALLDKQMVQFISIREHFDTTTPHGNLILTILVALGQFERETTSIRTRLAMRDRAERGLFNGGAIPLGYKPTEGVSGKLDIVEAEAVVVREAFEAYLTIGALDKTVRHLAEEGFRRQGSTSRRGVVRETRTVSWGTLRHVLRNHVYLGLKALNHDKRDLSEEDALALPEAERYRLVKGAWDPIIDADTFERVQGLLAENRARSANVIGQKHYDYVLAGIVRCGDCGQFLEGASNRKKQKDGSYNYYHYYRHAGKKPTTCTMQSGVQAEKLEEVLLGRLHRLADDTALLDLIIARANQRIEDNLPVQSKELAVAKMQVSALAAEHNSLVQQLHAAPQGMVPASFWVKAKELERQKEAAESVVARLIMEVAETKAARLSPDRYRAALRRFREVFGTLDAMEKADLLAYLLDRVVITKNMLRYALIGDTDAGRIELFSGRPEFGQPAKWLPTQQAALTGPEERVDLTKLWKTEEGPKLRLLRGRAERREAKQANPPAAEALRKAIAWQREIDGHGLKRADIARREGLTRARVTQIMSLLNLPEGTKQALLTGSTDMAGMTVRAALGMVL